jgi:HipA-like protein
MGGELAVWLYGEHVATIEQERGRPRLIYTQAALDRYPLGTPLLSLSLPVSNRRYPQGVVRPFLEGLLHSTCRGPCPDSAVDNDCRTTRHH